MWKCVIIMILKNNCLIINNIYAYVKSILLQKYFSCHKLIKQVDISLILKTYFMCERLTFIT